MKGMEAAGSRPYDHFSGSISSDKSQELERPGMVTLVAKSKFEVTGFFGAKRPRI